MIKFGSKILLLGLMVTLTACSGGGGDDGGGGGGGSTPVACTTADIANSQSVSGSRPNCVVQTCISGYTPNYYGSSCVPDSSNPGGGTGGVSTPTNLVYSQLSFTFAVDSLFSGITPTVNNCSGSVTCTYSVAPSLPVGLSLNSTTGKVSGTPLAISSRRNYIVTVSNSAGSTSETLSIAVNPKAPKITDPGDLVRVYQVNLAISGTETLASVTSGSGSVISITVSPALPSGMTLQTSLDGNGKISSVRLAGTPTVNSPDTVYTLTASGDSQYGNAPYTTTFHLSTETQISGFTYSFPNLTNGEGCIYVGSDIECTFKKGVSFTSLTPSIGQGNNISYSLIADSGYLSEMPAGIGFSVGTGNIYTTEYGPFEGSETMCASFCSYKVRASNNINFVERVVKIKITNPSAPTSMAYNYLQVGDTKYSFRKLQAPVSVAPTFTPAAARPACHGQGNCYSISPAITVGGVTWSSAYGEIRFNPFIQATLPETTFTVTSGSLSTTFKMEFLGATPVFNYGVGEFFIGKTGSPMIPIEIDINSIPANQVTYSATPTSFIISPALPAGLSIGTGTYLYNAPPPNGGAIIGTPTEIKPRTKYTITGCRDGACANVEIYITIRPSLEGVAIGEKHACAIEKDSSGNKILCWGSNDRGQLGFTSTDDCSGVACSKVAKYVTVAGNPLVGALEIAAGKNHTCAIIDPTGTKGTGKVYCWGDNSSQQIAPSASGSMITTPTPIKRKELARCGTLNGNPVSGCPGDYAAGADMDGAWAVSLGDGDTCLIGIAEVNIGSVHSVPSGSSSYGQSDLIVHCLGRNFNSTLSSNGQAARVGVDSNNIENTYFANGLGVGDNHVCFNSFRTDYNSTEAMGQTGVDDDNNGKVDDVSSRINTGRVTCFGADDRGQLGDGVPGSTTFSLTMSDVKIGGSVFVTDVVRSVKVGGNHSCATLSPEAGGSTDKQVYCWGSNSTGQLARNSLTDSSLANTMYNFGLTSGIAKSSSLVLTKNTSYLANVGTDYMLYYAGALPLAGSPYSGSSSMILSPVKLTSSTNFISKELEGINMNASQASGSMCYEESGFTGGSLLCWGNNDRGQLGDSTIDNSVLPVKVNFMGN